jgi:exo-beta-1,3-glucanase (GH17 family)
MARNMNSRAAAGLAFLLAAAAVWCFFWLLGRPVELSERPLAPGQKLQCVSYTPFARGESPLEEPEGFTPPAQRIRSDMRLLSRWSRCVRTYTARGLGPLPVIAGQLGMSVLLGVWVDADPKLTREEIEAAVDLAARYPKVVKAVIVGNEVLLRGEMSGEQLDGLIREVKGRVAQPVTYADVWAFWLKHPEVAPAVDFITIHILPYWEDQPVPIARALGHVIQVRREIAARYPGRELLIGETGWPSEGRMREGALPSPENQARFIRGFVALAEREGWRYNIVEAFDQPWKRVNEGAVGGAWGLFDTDRKDKHVLAGAVSNWPQWTWLAGLSCVVIAALLAGILRKPCPARRVFLAATAAAPGAVCFALQADQFRTTSCSLPEYLWAGVILALAFGMLWQILELMRAGRVPGRMPFRRVMPPLLRHMGSGGAWSALHLAAAFCAAATSVALAFDPRYRSFPVAGFLVPAVAVAVVAALQRRIRPGSPSTEDYREEGALGILLVAAAAAILVQETPLNWQADGWVLVCGLLGWSLLLPHFGLESKRSP